MCSDCGERLCAVGEDSAPSQAGEPRAGAEGKNRPLRPDFSLVATGSAISHHAVRCSLDCMDGHQH